jgi:sulfatase modifying factor 1
MGACLPCGNHNSFFLWRGEIISTEQANFDGTKFYGGKNEVEYREESTPVGSFPANALGLHDMHGNVWECCNDWYAEYPQEDADDPQGPQEGEFRVTRGGSYFNPASFVRSAFRKWEVQTDRGNIHVGFRAAMTFTP